MADGVFNRAKGAFVEMILDTGSKTIMMLLKANEAEATLVDRNTITLMLAEAGTTEAVFTNYGRKVDLVETVTQDDTNNRTDVDIPDQTFTSAGNGANDNLTKVVTAYENAAADTTRIPMSHHDITVLTDGSDLTIQVNASGIMRAA